MSGGAIESRKIDRIEISPSRITAKPGELVDVSVLKYSGENCLGMANVNLTPRLSKEGIYGCAVENGKLRIMGQPGVFPVDCAVFTPKDPEKPEGPDNVETITETLLVTVISEDGTIPEIPEGLLSKKRKPAAPMEPQERKNYQGEKLAETTSGIFQKTGKLLAKLPSRGLQTTREVFRTAGNNKDVVYLFLGLFFSFCCGASLLVILFSFSPNMIDHGINVVKLGSLILSFFGALFAALAKIYTPPGKISLFMSEKASGTSIEEKLAAAQERVKLLKNMVEQRGAGKEITFYERSITEYTITK